MKKVIFLFLFSVTTFYGIEPTHLFLIRHGETLRNSLGLIQGQEEVEESQLNEKGRSQAIEVSQLLKIKHPNLSTKFYSSTLSRAFETAQIVSKEFDGVRILKKNNLKEIDHGKHDGTDKHLRNKLYQQYFEREIAKWHHSHSGEKIDPYFKWKVNPLADTETCLAMCERAFQGLMEIGEENPGSEIAIFTHGGVIAALIEYVKPIHEEEVIPLWFEQTCVPNGAIAHFIYDPNLEKDQIKFVGYEK